MNPNMRNNGQPSIQQNTNQPKMKPAISAPPPVKPPEGIGIKGVRLLEIIENIIDHVINPSPTMTARFSHLFILIPYFLFFLGTFQYGLLHLGQTLGSSS
jgi:hypothetical protein